MINKIINNLIFYKDIIISLSSLIVSFLTLTITFYLGIRQNIFIKNQSKRDNQKYKENVEIQSRRFIIKYNNHIEFLPLCFISSLYDNKYTYKRSMFSEFNLLSNDVQNNILSYKNIILPRIETDLWDVCYDSLCNKLKEDYPDDWNNNKSFIYDNGKYLRRSISKYGKEKFEYLNFDVTNEITNILCSNNDITKTKNAIFEINKKYDLKSLPEKSCCEILTYTMLFISEYYNIENDYYYDSLCFDEMKTMEDLFLSMLLSIYTKLYLPNKRGEQ